MFRKVTVFAVVFQFCLITPAWAGSSEPLKVSGADAAKGTTQVAIGAFNVGFIF